MWVYVAFCFEMKRCTSFLNCFLSFESEPMGRGGEREGGGDENKSLKESSDVCAQEG